MTIPLHTTNTRCMSMWNTPITTLVYFINSTCMTPGSTSDATTSSRGVTPGPDGVTHRGTS